MLESEEEEEIDSFPPSGRLLDVVLLTLGGFRFRLGIGLIGSRCFRLVLRNAVWRRNQMYTKGLRRGRRGEVVLDLPCLMVLVEVVCD